MLLLYLKLEELAEEEAWAEDTLRMPNHNLFHLLDKWLDFGSFTDNWCFGMERACSISKRLVKVNRNSFKSVQKRNTTSIMKNIVFIRYFAETDMLCYNIPKGKTVNYRFNELEDKVREFDEIYGPTRQLVTTKDQRSFFSRGSRIGNEGANGYAKLLINDEWVYIKVLRIVSFLADEQVRLLLKYNTLNYTRSWKQCFSKAFDFCMSSNITSANEEIHWIWLDDSVQLFGIYVLEKYDNFIVDKHPQFCDIFRKHEE